MAQAHLDALNYLAAGGATRAFNLGYGQGASVKEVIAAVERVIGRKLLVAKAARRPGDAPRLVADGALARKHLGWTPAHAELEHIVATALAWEKRLAERPPAG